MKWTFNSQKNIPKDVEISKFGSNNKLHVPKVQNYHAGTYKCFGKDRDTLKYFVAKGILKVTNKGNSQNPNVVESWYCANNIPPWEISCHYIEHFYYYRQCLVKHLIHFVYIVNPIACMKTNTK